MQDHQLNPALMRGGGGGGPLRRELLPEEARAPGRPLAQGVGPAGSLTSPSQGEVALGI